MAKLITLYHPELDATTVQTEGAFYGKGGLNEMSTLMRGYKGGEDPTKLGETLRTNRGPR